MFWIQQVVFWYKLAIYLHLPQLNKKSNKTYFRYCTGIKMKILSIICAWLSTQLPSSNVLDGYVKKGTSSFPCRHLAVRTRFLKNTLLRAAFIKIYDFGTLETPQKVNKCRGRLLSQHNLIILLLWGEGLWYRFI